VLHGIGHVRAYPRRWRSDAIQLEVKREMMRTAFVGALALVSALLPAQSALATTGFTVVPF
jgi:hypothetical protein